MEQLSLLKEKVYQLCLVQTQLSEQIEQLQSALKDQQEAYIALSNDYALLKEQQQRYQSTYAQIKTQIKSLIRQLKNETNPDTKKSASTIKSPKPSHLKPITDEKKQQMDSFFKEDSIYFASDAD